MTDTGGRIALLGPQGSGKGTQGERLAAILNATHIASGDLVRAEIQAGTELGRTVQGYNDRGELVPDEIILELVMPHLLAAGSWILDGFPRDEPQARALDAALEPKGEPLQRVIVLEMSDDEVIARLSGRRVSQATGHSYHLIFNPPPTSDPGPFLQRADDQPEEIARRLGIYHARTEPLKEYYDARRMLSTVDANGDIPTVTARILDALAEAGLVPPIRRPALRT
jgi:adenylate kinase